MPRTVFGTKKVVRIDKHSRSKYTESDIRWEKFKMVLWVFFGYLYFHFIIMGWTL